ncbi:sushi, von Willebrand factor type A, EGF and pentraxin domain-containing protein 1 isoform X2 [Diabrotica virgifera virgifera]|uniref:Sushi, von Willebrand factor type A, EGF and pentraxin domain-containing protein 1 isoform X2 n=1 Tax=Diabrotica virgifera virgifera TaxID=50390 RepID=A0A6P7FDP8_DIAVI|nr:sushi, von Willebrand factor type A, EGF and pentraxin domain-containing protein 1 isoform X2 [Diabrotica virgifera virgifera]
MLIRIQAAFLVAIVFLYRDTLAQNSTNSLFSCPAGWELRGLNCYKFFNIRHSWEKAAELCRRYGSELMAVESYSENNVTASIATSSVPLERRGANHYWLGLSSLDDLRTNTLESAAGTLVSQYSGFWSPNQPDPQSGECVDVIVTEEFQSWELTTCESLQPFMCRSKACPAASFHCSNGLCINEKFKCDKQDDCGDGSDEIDCATNCNFYLASSGDVVESPYYPHKYAPLTNCKWTLEGPQGHNILLQFQEFETEKTFDTVQILAGGRTEDTSINLATLSGKQDLTNRSFVSGSNFMIIKFSTDASVERKGFRASWKTEPQTCGGTLRATPQGQVLTSPGYPEQYPGGLECLYVIQSQGGKIITLEVDDLDLDDNRDFILVRDGDSPKSKPIARLTGKWENNQKVIMSTGNQLYVYFRTRLGDSKRGFRIRYTQGCKATIVAKNGTISSPAFGLENYPSNQECMYKIRNPGGQPLSLNFPHFEVDKSDFVQVYDGSTTSGLRLHSGNGFTTGTKPKITLTASSGEMLVRFVTDALHSNEGWEAVFSADCPPLQPGIGALASSRDTAFGTIITFSCPTGQEFATGRNRITTQCLPGGNWSISYIPKCQEVYCGPVPQIDNGFSIGSSNVTYRGQAMYQCYAGFAFPTGQAIERISCLSDGHWEKKPNCLASQCATLPEVPHANATILNGLGRSYGTIMRYECEPGYIRSGPPVILCMSNGTWSGDVPVCSRAKCPKFPEIQNGFITDISRDYYYNDEARVQCYKGYKLIGNSILRCGENQIFNNPPRCEDINECISSQCDVASTECVNVPGSFHCKCRKGFESTQECRPVGDLGLVNGGIPDDSITVSSSEPGYEKSMVRLNGAGWCGNTIEGGSNWVLIDLKAPTVIRGFRTMAVQRLDGNIAFTSAVRIQYTDDLTDVFKDYRNPDGLAVEFTIEKPTLSILNLPVPIEAQFIKFKIQDYVGAPCLKIEVMGCTRLECADINECAVNNGGCQQKCVNSAGDYSCNCNVGFELYTQNGTASIYVENSENGHRDGDVYQIDKSCVPVMCPTLTSPENGVILTTKDKYHFGDLVRFQCDFGYVMTGSTSLLCTSSGVWNGTVPECKYAQCVSLPDNKNEGLKIIRNDEDSVLVPFRENVTLHCSTNGRELRGTATAGFRQCVYDPKAGFPDYWLSGDLPSCPRVDCGVPPPSPGAEYGQYVDTKYQSSFFFGCQNTFKLAGQSSKHDNVVRCQANGVWDFGDLRCEGPVCQDPGRPSDGFQISRSYEQGSEISFGCNRPGYILINPRPITCVRDPECKVVKPLGIASGKIPDSAINATSERPNYEARNVRLNSVTGWCGKQEAFTYVSVDLGKVYRVKAILVKGVVTNDIVGRPTEIRFFYKQADNENYVVYFPNFNLTMRDPGNYGELAMISLPKFVQARFVILGIVSYMENACLKFELMGCDEPEKEPLLGYDYGYSPCVDNETPVFQSCPQQPIIVQKDVNGGLLPVNFTEPTAVDNSGSIARLEVKPASFRTPMYVFDDMVVKYVAYDYDGNVAICEINITVPDNTPPQLSCPQSYVIELVDRQDSYAINFNETRRRLNTSDASGDVHITFIPDKATISIGAFENVTVIAADKYGNKASCHFQVSVQATPCVDWELKPPVNGALNCLPGDKGLQCIGTCNPGFRFTDGDPVKTFMCETNGPWKPSSVIPDCVSENTQQADYHFTASINYRANGAVANSCLNQYTELLAQYYNNLNTQLSDRCSAVNVKMNVTFIKSLATLVEENVVRIDYILDIVPLYRQPQIYDLCGSTLNLMFDLSVPYANAVVEPLLNVAAIGNQCPPLKALKSTNERGFTCNVGEVLNMDTNDVPRCLHCPAGTFAGEKQKECTYCPKGFYQNRDRQGSCNRCPQGTYTREEGSKSVHDCIPVCGYGTYSPTGLVPCLECPRNSFTSEPPTGGFKDCQACPANTFTYQPAAAGKDKCRPKCSPGYYSPTGLAPCSMCPKNFYQSITGQTACNECPSNMKTEGPGATGRDECRAVQCKENACQHGGLCIPMGHNVHCFCPAGFTGRRCEVDIDECTSQPCYNGGSCIDLPQGYKCQCPPGYSGINCQEERSDCSNDTCPARAMCKDEPGYNNYTCLCRSGYTGIDCDVTIDPCTANGNPCNNGASCIALQQGRFMCECLPGWEGQLCETNIDDCAEKPCLLGSNCTDLVNDFSCTCPAGFTGKRCQEKINMCSSSPCKNGVCIDKLFDYECICDPGWTGDICETNINDCQPNPCQNGGHCVDGIDDFKCTCEPGFTGKKCQHTLDFCSSKPCQNGATCTDLVDGFSCKCRPGFVGLQCEAEIDECLSDPCNSVGTERCVDLDNKYVCMCREGYTGNACEINIDDCQSQPCLNGGSCRDEVGSYRCVCKPGWTGGNCEVDIGSCQTRPCQNDARCIDLFQDYFCVCPSGTDGKQCETAPERCIGNPCMHGGKCQDFGSGLNCSCSDGFSGIGCQYEYDACQVKACKNGATCTNDFPGFKCVCPPGYTGKFCEEDIVDCKENSCPPSATCIDLTGKFYCQCPFNLTGEDCRKTISVDYDLYFSDATRSSASQVIPFYTGSKSSLTIALWVQFTQKDENGIFFTLYSVSDKHVPNNRRPIVQAHSNGVQISIFPDLQDVYLSYRDYTTINDAQWHHLAIVWDGENGGELKLITEGLIASKVKGYGSGRKLPQYAWVTLGKPQTGNPKAYTESGFQGHLTKVQIWGRALDVTNEVQKQVRDCRTEPVLYRGLILTWAGYEDTIGGVERIVPSHCGQRNCPPGYKGSKCQELEVDKIPPKVEYCPGDLWIITKNGSALVVWDEPSFSDNVGVAKVQEKSGHRPGQTLLWGIYQIAYVASDAAGNTATCTFKVSVLSEFCPELPDPIGGMQSCKDWGAGGQFKVCEIGCNPGLRFSQEIPLFYTCGAEGFWRPTKNPNLPLVYPACSSAKPAQRVFRIEMLFPSSVLCNEAGQGVLKQKVRHAVNALNRDWNFCSFSVDGTRECKELNIDVKCDHRAGRQTRQASEDEDGGTYVIKTDVPVENDPVVNINTNERTTVKALLEKLILEEDQFDVGDILPNTVPDPSSLLLQSDYACPVGQVVMAPDCVPCAIGTYYDKDTKTCISCAKGYYQSETGQTQCIQCPAIAGRSGVTVTVGARSAADCKERCPAGKFYDHEAGLCRSCGYGFYQPNEGSFSCEICGLGKTTRTNEAVSIKECRDECANGLQLGIDGKCEPCPRGTYRTQGIESACQMCPLDYTTQKTGAVTREECSLPVCKPGTYLNGTLNRCDECKKGFYQSEYQQTSCIPCPPNTSTKGPAGTSKSECTNPCETNDPEMQCDVNAYCLLIPEGPKQGEFDCECKPGFNGTGTIGNCFDVCDGYCENEGTCVKDVRGQPSCRCIGSFTGKHCAEKSEFAYIVGGIAASVILIIFIVLLIWMICARASRRKEPKKLLTPATDQNGSQVNFYYGAPTPYAESIAPSHHSTYAHYYDDEEDGWEMPNFYNETYMKESLHNGVNGKMNSLARSNASIYGTKDDLYDRLKRHAYPGKKDKSDSESEGQ